MLPEKNNIQNPALVIGSDALISNLTDTNIPYYLVTEKRSRRRYLFNGAIGTYNFSSYESTDFVDELCEAGRRFKLKPVLFCDDDRAMLNVSGNRVRLQKYFLFLYPSVENMNRFLDHKRFLEFAQRNHLPIPEFFQRSSLSGIKEIVPFVTYPCIIKPSNPNFWRNNMFTEIIGGYKKIIRCANSEKLIETYEKISRINPSVIVQNAVVCSYKKHFSANLFIDRTGVLRASHLASRIKSGGRWGEVINNEVLDFCKEIIGNIEIKGLVNLKLKQDCRTDEYKLMKISTKNKQWEWQAKTKPNLMSLYYQHLVNESLLYRTKAAMKNEPILN